MFAALIAASASVRYVGIDIGSQYLKLALSTNRGQAEIYHDPTIDSVSFPSAAALKMPGDIPATMTLSDFENLEVRIGRRALKVLKQNDSLGLEFIPRMIGRRQISELYTTRYATTHELFNVWLHQSLERVRPFDGIAVVVPAFYAPAQIVAIGAFARNFQIPVVAHVTEPDALFRLYGALKLERFRQSPKHVLFVDVGAMSTKVFSGNFTYNNTDPTNDFAVVVQTSSEWTEKVGGYHFAQRWAQAQNISIAKAQKELVKTNGEGFDEFFVYELRLLNKTISAAMERATRLGAIEEVQLIGGASIYRFVTDTVRKITGHTTQRDFKASEAIALGAVIAALTKDGGSPYVPTYIAELSALTLNLTFDDHTYQFCTKGDRCERVVNFEGLTEIPSEFIINGRSTGLPEGVNTTLAVFRTAVPINLTGPGPFNASFHINGLEIYVASAKFCTADGSCEESKTVPLDDANTMDISRAKAFVGRYLSSRGNKNLRARIITILDKLNQLKKKFETRKVEALVPMTDEMKDELRNLTELYNKDGLETLEVGALTHWNRTLADMAKQLRVKI
jgi:hypothetical protein